MTYSIPVFSIISSKSANHCTYYLLLKWSGESDKVLPVSWCRWGQRCLPADNGIGRSPTPCTRGCCWPGCCGQPGLGGRNSFPTDTSSLQQFPSTSPPAGSPWTAHRFATTQHNHMTFTNMSKLNQMSFRCCTHFWFYLVVSEKCKHLFLFHSSSKSLTSRTCSRINILVSRRKFVSTNQTLGLQSELSTIQNWTESL